MQRFDNEVVYLLGNKGKKYRVFFNDFLEDCKCCCFYLNPCYSGNYNIVHKIIGDFCENIRFKEIK